MHQNRYYVCITNDKGCYKELTIVLSEKIYRKNNETENSTNKFEWSKWRKQISKNGLQNKVNYILIVYHAPDPLLFTMSILREKIGKNESI